ncbi:MAG TPA: hypothetical protein HPP91_12480 [Gammaproteobacteria bacterium]|jgi:hypothetical protein|nr:hypothetical protein [Gammaproteobacteria bacterium]
MRKGFTKRTVLPKLLHQPIILIEVEFNTIQLPQLLQPLLNGSGKPNIIHTLNALKVHPLIQIELQLIIYKDRPTLVSRLFL